MDEGRAGHTLGKMLSHQIGSARILPTAMAVLLASTGNIAPTGASEATNHTLCAYARCAGLGEKTGADTGAFSLRSAGVSCPSCKKGKGWGGGRAAGAVVASPASSGKGVVMGTSASVRTCARGRRARMAKTERGFIRARPGHRALQSAELRAFPGFPAAGGRGSACEP